MVKRLAAIWTNRSVLGILVKRDLRVRYARSLLGYLWTIIDPLANALIYFMIFVVVFQRRDAGHSPYFLFLLTGLLPWQWFNAAVSEAPRALMSEQKLVKSTRLPRELWIIRMVIAKGIEFLLSVPILAVFFLFYWARGEANLDGEIALFPLAIALQFLLCVGLSLILAPVTVLVNDVHRVVRILLRIFFYLTPIIFTIGLLKRPGIPVFLRWVYTFNPLSGILELYRAGFFPNPVQWASVVSGVGGTFLTLAVGAWAFGRLEKSVLKEI